MKGVCLKLGKRGCTVGRIEMGKSNGTIKISDTTLEKVQEFYNWLQGESRPDGIEFTNSPKLTPEEAFCVIYYLQEELWVLPDKYEMCRECKDIYDSENEGACIKEESTVVKDGEEIDGNFPEEMYGLYCDNCRPD